MKELKSILRKAVEDNIISEKGGLKGIYDACKKLGYKGPRDEFEKKFFELVKSEIESSYMISENDLDSIAGGKGDVAKRIAAFGLALAGPAMGMSSQVGATFEGVKNLDVKAKFKAASKKVDDFVTKNPVKAAGIAAGMAAGATGALSAALVAAGFGVKALAARISACPLLAINKWDDQGDTKTFIGSFKELDGIIGKQDRGEDGKVTNSTITEDNLETKIGEIKSFFGRHELDKPVEEAPNADETASNDNENEPKKPEKKEESNLFNRIFQAVSRGNINKLRELVAEEETTDAPEQEELSDEAKAAAEAKEKAKKEAKIEKIYKYWEGAKADLKAAIQKAVKDPSIAGKFVNLALELQKAGLLENGDLEGDKVHENFTRAKAGMDDAERKMENVRQEANKKLEQKEATVKKLQEEMAAKSQELQEATTNLVTYRDNMAIGDRFKNGIEDNFNTITKEFQGLLAAIRDFQGEISDDKINVALYDMDTLIGRINRCNLYNGANDAWNLEQESGGKKFSFGDLVEKVANKLIDITLDGKKTATFQVKVNEKSSDNSAVFIRSLNEFNNKFNKKIGMGKVYTIETKKESSTIKIDKKMDQIINAKQNVVNLIGKILETYTKLNEKLAPKSN